MEHLIFRDLDDMFWPIYLSVYGKQKKRVTEYGKQKQKVTVYDKQTRRVTVYDKQTQ